MPSQILKEQTLDVDTVTGATMTRYAIVSAVSDCVEQAGGSVQAMIEAYKKALHDAAARQGGIRDIVINNEVSFVMGSTDVKRAHRVNPNTAAMILPLAESVKNKGIKTMMETTATEICTDSDGRASVDPVVKFKLVLIQHLYGIRSLRQTLRDAEVNVAYRWFIGYTIAQPQPHFATISYAFATRYPPEVIEEVNQDREEHGKKPFDDEPKPPKEKTVIESTTDPESGVFHKGEHKKCFAYEAHTVCDKHNFILDVNGNTRQRT